MEGIVAVGLRAAAARRAPELSCLSESGATRERRCDGMTFEFGASRKQRAEVTRRLE